MAKVKDVNWRNCILQQLHQRNQTQVHCFQDLIAQNNKLFDNANSLRIENIQLNFQNEKLRLEGTSGVAGTSPINKSNERIQQLEQKLLAQQEELTELHRRKGDHVQQIIDLNAKLQEKEKQLATLESKLDESLIINSQLKLEIKMHENNARELQNLNQVIRDEHQALQLAFSSLEDKLRKVQDENCQLVSRLIGYKSKDADKMNEENDNFVNNASRRLAGIKLSAFGLLRKKNAKMQKELEEACRDTRGLTPDDPRDSCVPVFQGSSVPTSASVKFDAHESEVNAVKWNRATRILATGGADRKVKLWEIGKGPPECKGVLMGSNAGIMSVDFDSTGTLILGASNDFASRVWTTSDLRLRDTFTGHSEKVMAAKFLSVPKVVTGSHDRTLKIWDLRSRSCIVTKFVGSSCNDLVTADGSGSTIISGHFDKRIRFWDTRADPDSCPSDILLNGKVTSLDLTRDGKYLVSCVRDDTLKLIDLRKGQIVSTFSCSGFKVGCDWARATFSPDGQYVAVGSADGHVYIWSVATSKVETILKEHTSAATATAWCPTGSSLASVDRSRKVIIWSDH